MPGTQAFVNPGLQELSEPEVARFGAVIPIGREELDGAPARQYANTLIVSDVHLGSDVCRAKDLVRTLTGWRFERLILLGDIFDDLNFKRLKKSHWKFLSYLRKVSKRAEVVWIKGNHDRRLFNLLAGLMGVEARKEFGFTLGERRFLTVHGDQFDRVLNDYPWLSILAGRLYIAIQRLSGRRQGISRFVKRQSKGWLRVSMKVAENAIDFAASRGADVVFCGHTHQAMRHERDGIEYHNTGCWTDSPATFVTIDEAGEVTSHTVR